MTLEKLMKQGDELLSSHIIPGSPDWEALHESTPDDIEADEDDDEQELDEIAANSARVDEIRSALSTDLQPLGEALAGALQAGDAAAMRGALRKISERMPELAGDAEAMTAVLTKQFTEALTGEDQDA